MTDNKRLKHLYNLLILTEQAIKGTDKELWTEFNRLYHPTESDVVRIKALYNINEGVHEDSKGNSNGTR